MYDPQTDDEGCFIKERENNNCYNYGNDIVTNTFAQPGVGSGEKWKKNTCSCIATNHFAQRGAETACIFRWSAINSSYLSHKRNETGDQLE